MYTDLNVLYMKTPRSISNFVSKLYTINMIANSDNFKRTFPDILDTIKKYVGMDKDFERLCSDFEEMSQLINYLENADRDTFNKVKNQIFKYKQIQTEIINEINNFILEEINNN